KTRRKALPPVVNTRQGVRYIAPADGDHGGTWIAVNDRGLTLCLLNGAGSGPSRASRGILIPTLMNEHAAWRVAERLWDRDLTGFAPFTLLALEPDMPAMIVEWNGHEKVVLPDADTLMPLTSSSYETERVVERRRLDFQTKAQAAGKVDAAFLYFFHESHNGHPDAFSTCMHRADAGTVSFSWVKVNSSEAEFFYSPEAPCRFAPGVRRQVPLVPSEVGELVCN
ncbi:MAG: NRDE family protein, partial [Acidobacteria bacterium]|nr:NRDE family protein [Acidobacteriota bacterium]